MKKKCPTCHVSHTRSTAVYCSLKCQDRAWQLKRKYNTTPDVVYKMYKEQKGKCAICDTKGDVRELGYVEKKSLCVDHDHDTLAIRELLCSSCNRGLGMFQDEPAIVERAAQYLRKHKRKLSGKRKQAAS